MTVNSPLLPQTRVIFFDAELAKNDPVQHARMVANDLAKLYTEIANAHNQGPEYSAQGTQPTPAPGQLLIWKDMVNHKRWLVYNDDGLIKKTEMK